MKKLEKGMSSITGEVLAEFNDTIMDYSRDKTVVQLFEEQVKKTPKNVAIAFEDEKLTYSELNMRANVLAHKLRRLGVGPDDYVVIIAERSMEMIIGIYGIIKAGGAYVPIDPTYPSGRIQHILTDVNPKVVLTYQAKIETEIPMIDLEKIEIWEGANENPVHITKAEDLIYCIYTSGTTGKPKGVMVEHNGVVNLRKSYIHDMGLTEDDVLLQFASICFSQSAGEILSCLTIGAVLCIAPNEIRTSPRDIETYINKHAVTFTSLTPKFIQELDPVALPSLRILESGGEAGNLDELKKWISHCRVINAYGMTEMTLNASISHVHSETDTLNIGRPIVGTQIYIMNDGKLCEVGIPGELCVVGAGVARGYLNQPDLTAEKFVTNPYGGGKLYRTGDLARWSPDGNIEYLGRIDEQVKIRGFRIELGEIERAIRELDDVNNCAVIARIDASGEQAIYAYLVSDIEINISEVRTRLSKILLEYMIPAYMTQIKSIPITRNGKLDKRALPEIEMRTEVEYIAPRNEKEKILSDIFKEVLRLEKISVRDNFFMLGGNSIKVMRVVAKVRAFNDSLRTKDVKSIESIKFTAQNLFDHPTIEALIQLSEKERHETVQYHVDDFKKINKLLLKNKINGKIAAKQSVGDVLITGVTGWLGAHVLDEFLTNEEGIAYCIVRGEDLTESRNRIKEILTNYFGDKYTNSDRIVAICGDISGRIIMDEQIDTIINCAANVKHYGSYQDFYKINVLGTQNMITLAKQKGSRLFHISTTFVFGDDPLPNSSHSLPDEASLFIGQSLENVYVRSKFESEVAVLQSRLDGLEAVVIRVGNLTNRYIDLKFQKNHHDNASLKRLKAFADLEMFPEEWSDSVTYEFSPVDLTANAIIKLAQYYHSDFSVFHAYNHREIPFSNIAKALSLTSISLEKFLSKVKLTAHQSERAHIYEAFVDFDNTNDQHSSQNDLLLSNDFSMWYLKQLGFDWYDIDDRYMNEYVEYFRKIGYWMKEERKTQVVRVKTAI